MVNGVAIRLGSHARFASEAANRSMRLQRVEIAGDPGHEHHEALIPGEGSPDLGLLCELGERAEVHRDDHRGVEELPHREGGLAGIDAQRPPPLAIRSTLGW